MDNFEVLKAKLEAFIRRFYINELLKGAILFISIGLLYFIATLLIEYFLWLSSGGRLFLFWAFILVESILFLKFIVHPLTKLFKLSNGINYAQASKIIGNHFPEVRDKLLNLLQLKDIGAQSELLLAGIDQKAQELKPVPFSTAIDFRSNLPFLKYAAIPVLIIGIIFISGNSNLFADSYERVVHYKKAYAPPAPFSFMVMNGELKTQANKPFRLQVSTIGNVFPENPSVHFNGQVYYLNALSPGLFEYIFESPNEEVNFYLSGNGVTSENYTLEVVDVPRLRDFEMHLNYPAHTGLKDESLKGSGNATIPEGTSVQWKLKTVATNEVSFHSGDSAEGFIKDEENLFSLEKQIMDHLTYEISTSNTEVKNYEKLSYAIEVVKDQYPELELEHTRDSIENDVHYFFGKVSDDYGISGARMVYYPTGNPDENATKSITIPKAAYAEFLYSFPDTLTLSPGTDYEFYFQVFDNDAIHNYKSVKSQIFSYRKKTEEELKEERLNQQNEAIRGLDESLGKMKFSEKELQELSRLQKEKENLSYSDRKKLENFLNRQKQQNELMKQYSEKLKKSLQNEDPTEENELKEQLEERIERKEERLQENEKLLEELQKYGEKISQEELGEKLEKLSKNNQNQEKSLEQLLELTKRYYVKEKGAKISRDLEKLSEKQNELSESEEENTKEAQDSLNKKFDDIQKNMNELKKENEGLKKPIETGSDEEMEQEIEKEQQEAGENLEKENKGEAKRNQKKAAEKMKDLSKKMQQQMQASMGEQMQEDAKMLRQVLDNLITFSFEQETLLDDFRELGRDNPSFANKLRRQNVLKSHFRHVDDSLYALALRNPMISENIIEKLTNIEYDIDKALDRLAQNEIPQGLASQQYVVTGANDLAYFLSQILGNMQDMMSSASSSGSGNGEMQLPDIIKKQQELNDQMGEGLEKKGKQQEGKKSGETGEERGEDESGELFRIFKEQQELRNKLKEILEEKKAGARGEAIEEEMKKIEEELLEQGFNENTRKRMLSLEHRLLELEEADLQQGEKNERESNSGKDEFENTSKNQILKAREYFNTKEILNRQALPLRQIYKLKVK